MSKKVPVPAVPAVAESPTAFASVVINPRGLNIVQAALYSGMTPCRVRTLIKERKIKYIFEGKRYIVLRDSLDGYQNAQEYKARA
jgi:hypothetical protein